MPLVSHTSRIYIVPYIVHINSLCTANMLYPYVLVQSDGLSAAPHRVGHIDTDID